MTVWGYGYSLADSYPARNGTPIDGRHTTERQTDSERSNAQLCDRHGVGQSNG